MSNRFLYLYTVDYIFFLIARDISKSESLKTSLQFVFHPYALYICLKFKGYYMSSQLKIKCEINFFLR